MAKLEVLKTIRSLSGQILAFYGFVQYLLLENKKLQNQIDSLKTSLDWSFAETRRIEVRAHDYSLMLAECRNRHGQKGNL